MKQLLFLAVVFFVMGCDKTVSKEAIGQLNGYWEIDYVAFPDGQKKEYRVNPSIDYIELDNMQGFKKKVYPKFNGTYDTSNDAEKIKIIKKEGSFLIIYDNKLSSWEEKLVNITANSYTVINQDDITYAYKRYEPINIQE